MTVGSGNEERAITDVRYGGRISDSAAFRAYAKYRLQGCPVARDRGVSSRPDAARTVGGRLDWRRPRRRKSPFKEMPTPAGSACSTLRTRPFPVETSSRDGHGETPGALRRRKCSTTAVERNVPDQFGERRNTFDIDVQQNLSLISGHSIVFGGGYRVSDDDTDITRILFFEPKGRTTHLFNVFAQDEISLGRGVFGTLGSKLEHNSYSGWELQPTGRVRWTEAGTRCGALSRALFACPRALTVISASPAGCRPC